MQIVSFWEVPCKTYIHLTTNKQVGYYTTIGHHIIACGSDNALLATDWSALIFTWSATAMDGSTCKSPRVHSTYMPYMMGLAKLAAVTMHA